MSVIVGREISPEGSHLTRGESLSSSWLHLEPGGLYFLHLHRQARGGLSNNS